MLTAGVMWLFGVPFIVVILIYFLLLRKREIDAQYQNHQ